MSYKRLTLLNWDTVKTDFGGSYTAKELEDHFTELLNCIKYRNLESKLVDIELALCRKVVMEAPKIPQITKFTSFIHFKNEELIKNCPKNMDIKAYQTAEFEKLSESDKNLYMKNFKSYWKSCKATLGLYWYVD